MNSKGKMRVVVIWVVAVLAGAMVRCARAEGFFFIERPKLGLGTSYEFEEEKRTIPDSKTETTSRDVLENVTIETNGWVYHENLMEYHLSLQPEWRQEEFEQDQPEGGSKQNNERDTSILAYDVGATFLKQKPYSLGVFASRNTRHIDLSYARDSDIESELWGARLSLKNSRLPASIGFISKQSVQTGFYRSEEDRDELQVALKHNTKKGVTELNIIRDDGKRTTWTISPETATIESVSTNAELTNTHFFSEDDRLRLDSQIYRALSEYDGIDHDSWMVSENLFWSPSKDFLVQSAFNFNQRKVNGVETKEKTLGVLLTRRLEEILTTNFGIEAADRDYIGGSEDRYRMNYDATYRRPVPWGDIELGATLDYGVTYRSGVENVLPTEERHVLRIGEDAFLKADDIALNTIVVTNISRTVVYIEDIDYRIYQIGSDVIIARTLSGNISDGQEVIVHYGYRVPSGYDDARFGRGFRLDMALGSFTYLTYTYDHQDQTILSGDPPVNQVGDISNRVRLRFDVNWSETRFEYEKKKRKSGVSTETKSVKELINFRTFKSIGFHLSGHYGKRKYIETAEKETFYTLGTEITWTPEWWCSVSLMYLANDITGDRQDMEYSELSPKMQLNYGVWKAALSYRLTDQKDKSAENELERQRLYFVINRELW